MTASTRLAVLGGDFQCAVVPRLQFGNSLGMDVESDDRALLAELHRQWQSDITQSDDCDGRCVADVVHG